MSWLRRRSLPTKPKAAERASSLTPGQRALIAQFLASLRIERRLSPHTATAYERDLLGFDIARAAQATTDRLQLQLASSVADAYVAVHRLALAKQQERYARWVAWRDEVLARRAQRNPMQPMPAVQRTLWQRFCDWWMSCCEPFEVDL